MKCVRGGVFASMWQLHGLASVMCAAIRSHYPYGGANVTKHTDRLIQPRQKLSGTHTYY